MQMVEEKRKVTSTGFKTSGFGAEFNSVAFKVLSSTIYTRKGEAVVREVSCNAYDGHDEAGCTDVPFDVTLPTDWEPNYVVRDYGVGLTDEEVRGYHKCVDCKKEYNLDHDGRIEYRIVDMEEVYVPVCDCGGDLEFNGGIYNTYFKSTKRNKKTQIGCLGLGSKSPFCIADSFQVDSYKDGVHNSYSCYFNEDNEPAIAKLFTKETDEPNGVRVELAVGGYVHEIRRAAVKVYKHFKVLPNFVNDEGFADSIESARDEYTIVGKNYRLTGRTGQCYALMGNVAYEIPSEFINLEGVIDFELGDLAFNAGRESLSLDERTTQNLQNRVDLIKTDLAYDLFCRIRKEKGIYKRAMKLESLKHGVFGTLSREDQGRLNAAFRLKKIDGMKFKSWKYMRGEGLESVTEELLPTGHNIEYFRVGDDLSIAGYKTRIKEYVGGRYSSKVVTLLTQTQIDYFEIPDEEISDLDDLPQASSSTRSTAVNKCRVYKYGGTDYRHSKRNWIEADVDLDDDVQRVYVEINRYIPTCRTITQLKNKLRQLNEYFDKDILIYGVKSTLVKTKKFQNSEFISLQDFINQKIVQPEVYVTQDGPERFNNLFCKLAEEINVDELTEFSLLLEQQRNQIPYGLIDWSVVERDNTLDDLYEKILERYPMIKVATGSWTAVYASYNDVLEYVKMVEKCQK